jgi:hypothetical protein
MHRDHPCAQVGRAAGHWLSFSEAKRASLPDGSRRMIKKLLNRVVSVLPESAQFQIRDRYWRVKSKLLYQSFHSFLKLEHTLDSGLTIKAESKGEWWIYKDIFVNCEYDVPIRAALAASSNQPFVVLDLGANVGYFTFRVLDLIRRQHFDHILPDITMVEGSPDTIGKLQHRIRSQRLAPAKILTVHGFWRAYRKCAYPRVSRAREECNYRYSGRRSQRGIRGCGCAHKGQV